MNLGDHAAIHRMDSASRLAAAPPRVGFRKNIDQAAAACGGRSSYSHSRSVEEFLSPLPRI